MVDVHLWNVINLLLIHIAFLKLSQKFKWMSYPQKQSCANGL